jgi:zinc protease
MLKTTLDNGLRVIVQENHAAKVAAIQVWVHVGSADELLEEAGIAHVHEHMLFKGTERRKVGEIAATIEAAGGDINAWTSYDETVYHVTMASRDFPVGLDILADAVQHSSFDATELERELEVVLEEIRRGNDTPSRVMSENLFKTAFTAHPYSRPVIGWVDSVKSFTRDKIVSFYKRWYRPQNMCLVVVGDVNESDVLRRAEGLFDKGASLAPLPDRPRKKEPAQRGLRTILESQQIQETHLGVAWHGVEFKHEDTPALDVLSILLGSGDSSRLFRRLKRDQELVNDCYAFAYTPEDPGLLMVGATIHGGGVKAAYRGLLKEAMRLHHEEPSQAEVDKARTILLSEAVFQKETVQGMARKMGFFELVAGGPEYEDIYYSRVRQVTPADVRRVAQTYFGWDNLTVSGLLPAEHKEALPAGEVPEIAAEVKKELEGHYHPRPIVLEGAAKVARVKLKNGATLLVKEDNAVPLVSVRAFSVGGLLTENTATNGVSHLVGELMVRGTKRFSADQIAEETDATASNVSGMSGRNSLGIRGEFLKENFLRGFEIFSSCLLEPTFEPTEIERERKTQIEDIASRQDNLSAVCFDALAATMWNSHPYRMPMMGTKESVEKLTREHIVEAYRTQLRPDRLCFAVVGSVDVSDTIALFERTIGAVSPAGVATPHFPEREAQPTAPRAIRASRRKEQAHLALGFPGVALTDERRWVLEILASILGGQGGRLFLELRDKQSLAYSVTAFDMEGYHPGYFAAYIGTAQEKLETAERMLRSELEKVIDTEVESAELERAQRYLIGSHEIGLQRASSRAATMALNEAYGLGFDYHTSTAARIAAVTKKQVREVAREIIRFDHVVRSVVEVEPEGGPRGT